jgi:3',5'-cyclic AMP phosphodiesterase CpdA
MSVQQSQGSPAGRTHRILHLSDPHLTGSGFDEDGVDAAAALERMLLDARHLSGLDLVVVSGDIADDGSVAGCAGVRERVGEFAAERGIPHVYCTGNHDTREGFAAALGSGHLGPDGTDVGRLIEPAPDTPVGERAAVSEVLGLRVITLDSLVPGKVHGLVSAAQLSWLAQDLAEPAPAGSIVVLHHPPVFLESPPTRAAVLQNPDDLGAVLAGTDVRAVLCGHLHLQLSGSLYGVPVWATPGIVTRVDATAPPHLLRAVKGAGASVVDLGGPFSPMFHTLQARDPLAGVEVYELELGALTQVSTGM